MIFNNKYTPKSFLLIFSLVFTLYSCKDDNNEITTVPNQISWKTASSVTADAGSATISITGAIGTKWTVEITAGTDWCSFVYEDFSGGNVTKQGEVTDGTNVVYLYYSTNTGAEERIATVSVNFDGEEETHVLSLKQVAAGQSVLPDDPFDDSEETDEEGNKIAAYVEVPTYKEDANYLYTIHYVKLNNQDVRNYSLCLDKTKKAALWVAYPLHNAYMGSAGRNEEWTYDPLIDTSYQPMLFSSYKGNYDRGHQLPSADRQATDEMNRQTFYFSNMTPQLSGLNQNLWATLESKVRNNICDDTLYVVTGCYFENTTTTTYDGGGNTVPVPTHYFKVLLRTTEGRTGKSIANCTASELKSIGFWVEQKAYGSDALIYSTCTSVATIEEKTGFTFFPTAPEEVKQTYNPTDWNISSSSN